MIVVRLTGGLGNQMFQYAFGRQLSVLNSCGLYLDISSFRSDPLRDYSLGGYRIKAKLVNSFGYLLLKWASRARGRYRLVKERDLGFNPRIKKLKGDLFLKGIWQSELYFREIRRSLEREFTIVDMPDSANKALLKRIRDSESVCVHVRLGDYVEDKKTRKAHRVCSREYYLKGIRLMKSRMPDARFFIFSDDPEAAGNYGLEGDIVNLNDEPWMDMHLMKHCKHFIISNSSFSWWAAWLAENPDKIVLAPERWFNDKPNYDILPEEWALIAV